VQVVQQLLHLVEPPLYFQAYLVLAVQAVLGVVVAQYKALLHL